MARGDMREADFRRALKRHGIRRELMGYYDVGGACVYARNGGESRRQQLAYLLKAQRRHAEREDRAFEALIVLNMRTPDTLDPAYLPALTDEERAAMDAIPADFVERLLAGDNPASASP